MNTTTMTREKILHFASAKHGLLETWDAGDAIERKVSAMVASGLLVRRERTASLPAYEGAARAGAAAFGFPLESHDATIVNYFLTDAGRATWLKGNLID